ncbi:hypothetical protein, partial [Nonomuraea rubra]|uniref:hypothetical protein n=1 Tax=Nonomuraea rubra TaxID=46180 RepID=UPI00361845F5
VRRGAAVGWPASGGRLLVVGLASVRLLSLGRGTLRSVPVRRLPLRPSTFVRRLPLRPSTFVRRLATLRPATPERRLTPLRRGTSVGRL